MNDRQKQRRALARQAAAEMIRRFEETGATGGFAAIAVIDSEETPEIHGCLRFMTPRRAAAMIHAIVTSAPPQSRGEIMAHLMLITAAEDKHEKHINRRQEAIQ